MNEPFKVLADFLKQFEPQVAGRASEPPPTDVRQKLELFARGELSQDERGRLCAALIDRPEWVEMLVREVKSLRGQE